MLALKSLSDSQVEWTYGPDHGISRDRLYDGTELRKMIDTGKFAEEIISMWQPERDAFVERSSAFHLYYQGRYYVR